MRQWNINPKFLCRNHLLGEHKEIHMAVGWLRSKHRNGLQNWTNKGFIETDTLRFRHRVLVVEMKHRNYNHYSPLPTFTNPHWGHTNREYNFKDLMNRCKECKKRLLIPTMLLLSILFISSSYASQTRYGYASYYTRTESKNLMANGKELNDYAYTCASWDYPFGTHLCITNVENNKRIQVTVTDRGPNKRLYLQGRIIDLSYAAMHQLDGIESGLICVSIEVVDKDSIFRKEDRYNRNL